MDSNLRNPSPTLSYASMFISSTPQSIRGSPVLRSRSNSLPNNYLNNIQTNVSLNKMKSRKKESNGKARKSEKTLIGKGNSFIRKQKHKKSTDELTTSNHVVSSDSLLMRGMNTRQCSNRGLGSNSRQGERERQKVLTIQDRIGSYVARGSESVDFRELKSTKAAHL